MAALVQSYPQQSGTGTMLQTRPMPSPVSGGQQYMAGPPSSQRNSFHGLPGTMAAPAAYRGTSGPIQPYAFTSTPSLNTNTQWQQFPAYRTTSSPAVPTVQSIDKFNVPGRLRHGGSQSVTSLAYNSSMGVGKSGSRDDSSIRQPRTVTTAPRPQSAYMSGTSTQLSLAQAAPVKPSPERYRRAAPPQRSSNSAPPSGSGMTAINHLYNPTEQKRGNEASPARRPGNFNGSAPGTAVDDMQLYRRPTDEETKRLRRRSMPALDSADFPKPQAPLQLDAWAPEKSKGTEQAPKAKFTDKEQKSLRMVSPSAAADSNMQNKNGSAESLVSTRSSNSRPSSSANRNAPLSAGNSSAAPMLINGEDSAPTQDYPKLINIPPRGSSDVGKRVAAPSPLSQPVTMASDAAADQMSASPRQALASPPLASPSTPVNSNMDSPAAKHLAAINEKGNKGRSKTSRLRRAFSFGSAADFRKAAGADAPTEHADGAEPTRLHKEPTAAELYDVEQARIAKKQEEGGIGNSIYGGKLFSGSTDNISISSTASSASIMIRKMGRGVKRSTRSLVGLFRPKSVIGAPTTDALAPETSQASVSMVTAEAERDRVNVHADVHTQVAGGTGFPHLERNSIDAGKAPSMVSERAGSSGTDNSSAARRSIVGSDKDRAEVLAAVRKGILKGTSGSSSPVRSAVDAKGTVTAFDLPSVPSITDSPQSSVPSTPTDEAQGHKRSGSVAIGNEDYFVTALRLRQDTKSAPGTPRGTSKRNATFSPRIVFYDTWPSQEYDRRGEIATCNRLTPMLAQQIKEELNNFKMEMEVHENSKIYTHFF